MARKSIKKNYLYNVSYQVLLLLVPLITTPYVSRVLGAEGIGTFSFATSIVTYFVIFATLGTTTYGQREVSYVQRDEYGRSVVFFENVVIRLVSTAIACVAYLVTLRIMGDVSTMSLVLTLNVIAVATDVSWFFQGLEEFGKVVGRNFVIKLVNIACIFLFVKTADDLVIYALIMCALPIVGNLSLVPFLRRYIVRVKASDLHPIERMPTVLSLFVPAIAIQVYTVLDKTMIGVITADAAQNGYYEQSQKLANMALTLVTSLGTVMVPRIGSLYADGKTDEVRESMSRTYRFVWFLALPLAFGLGACASNLVPWFFGKGFDEVVLLLQIFGGQIVAIGVNNATGIQYLIPIGKQNLFTLSVCIGAGVNFVLNLFLIPFIGAAGAAIASVVAESVIAIFQLIKVRHELDVRAMVKSSFTYLVSSGIMCVVLLLVSGLLVPGPLQTMLLIALGVVVYAVCLLVARDAFLLEVIDIFKRKVLRRG